MRNSFTYKPQLIVNGLFNEQEYYQQLVLVSHNQPGDILRAKEMAKAAAKSGLNYFYKIVYSGLHKRLIGALINKNYELYHELLEMSNEHLKLIRYHGSKVKFAA